MILFSFLILVVGLALGSFLNVLIYRLPRGESIVHPPSHCPVCGEPIKWYDNVPLVSFLVLKGRCRSCTSPILWRYPLVEGLTASLFLFSFISHQPYSLSVSIFFLRDLIFIVFLIPIFFIDLEKEIIPNTLSYPLIIVGLPFALFSRSLSPSLVGIGLGAGLFFVIRIVSFFFFKQESMGFGDVKLAAGIGSFLGWSQALLSFFLSFLLGAVISVFLLALHIKGRKDRIPFAPFLVSASIISLYFGQELVRLYGSLLY